MKEVRNFIEDRVRQAAPGYFFTHEGNEAMNGLSQRIPHGGGVVVMERLRTGTFLNINSRLCKVYQINMYFFKFVEIDAPTSFDPSTYYDNQQVREDIFEQLETEAVNDFVRLIQISGALINTMTFGYPYGRPRFDGNDMGVTLAFQLAFPICAEPPCNVKVFKK